MLCVRDALRSFMAKLLPSSGDGNCDGLKLPLQTASRRPRPPNPLGLAGKLVQEPNRRDGEVTFEKELSSSYSYF